MLFLTILVLVLAMIGHAAFWVAVVNRSHSTGLPRIMVKIASAVCHTAQIAVPAWFVWYGYTHRASLAEDMLWQLSFPSAYLVFAAAYGAAHVAMWLLEQWQASGHPGGIVHKSERVVDMIETLGRAPALGWKTKLATQLPGNQLWQLHVHEFSVAVERLPRSLDGLSIGHWSDLHLAGRIDRPYFEEMVRLTNEMDVDLIALTGDICDVARYIDWIPEMLGPARARLGKFFILGNHDLRTRDVLRLRAAMEEAGFVDLGTRVEMIADGQIMIFGNERPWIKTFVDTSDQAAAAEAPLKIVLSHSPDQFGWAQRNAVDLMLAGHTHGGQIRFPIIGPVLCPSWHGTRYACGFFYDRPTMMHVSRGTASLFPVRINCPPEISKLVLKRETPTVRA